MSPKSLSAAVVATVWIVVFATVFVSQAFILAFVAIGVSIMVWWYLAIIFEQEGWGDDDD